MAPGEAADDFLQLLSKPHLKEPADRGRGSGEGLPSQRAPNPPPLPPVHSLHLHCVCPM